MTIKLSIEARTAVRKALTSHVGWKAYYKANNLNISQMKTADILFACKFLGIDVAEIAARANRDAADASNANYGNAHRAENSGSADKEMFEAMAHNSRNEEAKAVFAEDGSFEQAHEERATVRTTEKTGMAEKLMALIAEMSEASINEDDVAAIVERHIRIALEKSGTSVTINLDRAEWDEPKKLPGRHHHAFPALVQAATARKANGQKMNIYMAGPAASGKTFAVGKVAEALGVPFHFNGAVDMEHKLTGFIDASGFYHRTAFREAYEHGGCYLFDECDGSDNAPLLAVNAGLAGAGMTFPDGYVARHPDCVVFAAANTWGNGASAEYVGRTKLDGAFLNRFIKFAWNYDEGLERDIYGNPDFALRVQKARTRAAVLGLKVLITPRATESGAALIAAGFTPDEAAEYTYLADLTADQRAMIEPAE